MTGTQMPKPVDLSGSIPVPVVRPVRRGAFLLAAAITVAAGVAFNWQWLVAVGAAPLLLSVLPCVAMCALGVCMSRLKSSSGEPVARIDKAPGGCGCERRNQ